MQRGRLATSAGARSTASSGKTSSSTTSSARSRIASEKAGAATTVAPAARTSKSGVQKAKAPAVLTPAARKRALSSAQSKAGATKSGATANNQEEQPQQEEDSDADHGAADAASVCSASDVATVGWLISSDYRLVTAVRVRPMLPAEKKKGYQRIVDMAPPDEGGWTRIVNPVALTSSLSPPPAGDGDAQVAPLPPPVSKQFTHEFAFDYSFWSYDHAAGRQVATQGVVYESLGGLAIETVLQGSNCAILAYGQSGTGKTFTMTGGGPAGKATASTTSSSSRVTANRVSTRATGAAPSGTSSSAASSGGASRRGLTPRICRGLFDRLEELQQDFGDKSAVHVSYVEVYNERVYDLLLTPANAKKAQEPLKVREHPEQGTYVENARQVKAATFDAVQALLEEGNRQRSVASTTSNGRSSRSHAVMTLTLTHQTPPPLSTGKEGHSATVKKSKLYLVDLAGSERADATETDNSRQRETSNINRSLATLADVVSALAKRSIVGDSTGGNNVSSSTPFVPYRNSVLTRLLKESLGGDATTVLLATISPCCAHFEDTLSTLKFVGRAKNALSVPKLPSPSPSLLGPATAMSSVEPASGLDLVHELRKEILELREKLEAPPPASEAHRPSFPLALSWVSPSPDAMYSRPENAFDGCGAQNAAAFTDPSSTDTDQQSSSLIDAVADATRWALQYAPSPMLEEPLASSKPLSSSSPSSARPDLDENEKARLEEELAELKATLSRKEYEFECQRVTTRALQDRVAAQILSQHLILTNLLSIRRRWLQLQAMRAFQRWRTNTQGTSLREERVTTCEHVEIQTDPPLLSVERKKISLPAVQLDALCHSVVGDFVFTADEQTIVNNLPLQNSSQPASVDYDEAQQQAMDCNTLSIIIDGGFDESGDLEGGSPPGELQGDDDIQGSAPSTDCAGSLVKKQQYIETKLASCLDSIDLARKAMGPTLRRLWQLAASSPAVAGLDSAQGSGPSASIGAERSLLVNLDKRLATLGQVVEAMRDGLAQRNMCTVNHGVAATAVFEHMEALVSAFCLHMLGRVNDQLVSGVSGCALGRQEIELQLRAFREQLAQLLQLVNAVMARGELHPQDHNAILFLVMELVGICEHIECVWLAIEQRKRYQLANQRVSAASRYEVEQLSVKLRHMETNSRALSESLDAQVLETARIEDELATALEQLHNMEEPHAAQVAALEIQLAECEARASEFEKSNVEISCTAKAQSSRIEQLEQQLAELSKSFQALHETQDGTTASDESSPITLRCGNLMVRLEEELTSALCRMNAMEPTSERSEVASPLASMRASPSASPLMKEYDLQLAAINSELSELAATTPIEQPAQSPSHNESDSPSSEEGVGELKAAMERDLFAASVHENELEAQLAEALTHVCHLQAQHEALMGSVHSLNCELSEALGRVASLEDERMHQCDDSKSNDDSRMGNQRLITISDAQSALLKMDGKLAAAKEQLAEQSNLRCRLEAIKADRDAADAERADLASQLAKEQAHCQELTRQVEAAVEHLTELRGQAGTPRIDLENAIHCRQQWEAQTQEKDAVISAQAAQLNQLKEDLEALKVALETEKEGQRVASRESAEQTQALRDEVVRLTEQASAFQLAMTESDAAIQQYEARVEPLEALAASKAAIIETLNQQIDKIQADSLARCEMLSQSLSEKVSAAGEAEKRYAEVVEELKAERGQLARLQTELSYRNEKVDELQQELGNARRQANLELKGRDEAITKLRSEIEVSSEAARVLGDRLKSTEAEQVLAMGSAEQQIADLQGEADLLRLLLRKQQDGTVKDQAEREEMQSTLDGTKSALATAVAKLEQANIKLAALESDHITMSTHAAELEARNAGATQQLVSACNALATSSAWKQVWFHSIVQCGVLNLQLQAEAIERRRIEQELLRKRDAVTQHAADLEAMRTELGLSEQAKHTLQITWANLATDVEQHRGEIALMREQISGFESRERQCETEYMELQLLHDLAEQEKRKLQNAVERSESALQARNAEYEAAKEKHDAQVLELEVSSNERIVELEAMIVSWTTNTHEKEAELLNGLDQANALVEELKVRALELERHLERERESVQALRKEVQNCRAETVEQTASIQMLQASIASRDDTIAAQTAQIERATVERQVLIDQCTRQERELKELTKQCEDLRDQVDRFCEWKHAWSRSIAKCGALQLQLNAAKTEVLQLNEALHNALSRMKVQDTGVALLRSELQRAIGIGSGLESARKELQDECCLRESRLREAQSEILALTHRVQFSESELVRVEHLLRKLGEEKRALENQASQSGARVRELEAEVASAAKNHATFVRELEGRHASRELELEQAIEVSSQNALERDARWQEKEATLEGVLDQQNDIIVSLRLRHEEVAAQCQSLEEQHLKLQGDLAAEKLETRRIAEQSASAAVDVVERTSQRLREVEAASFMQLAELESFRWWVATEHNVPRRRTSAELLDQAVAAYNLEPSEEAKRAVMQHLSSLDEWFERTIVAGQTDEVTQSSLEVSPAVDRIENVDSLPSIQIETPVVDLETLTNELLELCSTTKHLTELPRTDTLETICMPSVIEVEDVEEDDDDEKETTIAIEYEFEDVFGESLVTSEPAHAGDNNAGDGGDSGVSKTTGDNVRTAKAPANEPETSASEAEVAHLKSTIWRLKEVLDAKDDMLGFMDEKLSYYEQLLGKHQPQQQQQQQRQGSRSTTTSMGRR